jgi:hypothetical protein
MDDDQRQMQEDLEHQEQLAIDCVTVVYKHGLEGTARQLAALLGVSSHFKCITNAQSRTAILG